LYVGDLSEWLLLYKNDKPTSVKAHGHYTKAGKRSYESELTFARDLL